ncbi:MAG: hypothetical protein IKD61_02280 [Oscillospiraceae bacterium]|nr:hypothetical protein [Oscillospiraceae bacterium]
MNKLSLNSVDQSCFRVAASETADNSKARADIVSEGRLLFFEHSRKGANALRKASGGVLLEESRLSETAYSALNKTFQVEHLLYAAKKACDVTGETAPETFEQFKRLSQNFYSNGTFLKVLQGIYQEIITPILPAVYSEAVDRFADVVEVGFGETYAISVGSDDIPVFQDSAWGSARSVPANRFYSRDITLNPQPKTAEIRAKWMQLVGNNMDFGRFFANLVAGMYAKTMALWNSALMTAASGTTYIPSGLTGTFSNANWINIANKLSAVNNTTISNLFATGSMVALSKVLPTDVTGSTNVNMDAAIATLLGADYTRSGYLGEFMAVRLMPLMDAVIPGTQYSTVSTVLSPNDIWMLAGNGRKPLTMAYHRDTPISIEIEPERTASFELIFNLTIALDSAAVFASKIGHITVS